jgi:hypothetical protein
MLKEWKPYLPIVAGGIEGDVFATMLTGDLLKGILVGAPVGLFVSTLVRLISLTLSPEKVNINEKANISTKKQTINETIVESPFTKAALSNELPYTIDTSRQPKKRNFFGINF